MKKKNQLIRYTQHEKDNLFGGKIKIAETFSDFNALIKLSIKENKNLKIYLGKLNFFIAQKIMSDVKINLENYNISIQFSSIKHILKNHGDKQYENQRGQEPIEYKDFHFIMDIITDYDKLDSTIPTKDNNETLKFEKLIKNQYYKLVLYISHKNYCLEIKTMWKSTNKKNFTTAIDTKLPRIETSKTHSSTSSSDNNLPQI